METLLPRLLVSYRTIPQAGISKSQPVLMSRKIRVALTISYVNNETLCYKKNRESNLQGTGLIMQSGPNKWKWDFTHADQVRLQPDSDEEIYNEPESNEKQT